MKIHIEKKTLVAIVAQVINAAEAHTDIPILSTVKFEADNEKMTVTSTDLDVAVEVRLDAGEYDIEKAGSCCIDGRTLSSFVKRLRNGLVTIWFVDGIATVSCGAAKMDIPALHARDFPGFSGAGVCAVGGNLEAGKLSWALSQVAFAISTEEARFYINGPYMHVKDGALAFTATDGHRLAMATIDLPGGLSDVTGCIIPRKTVGLVQRIISCVSSDELVSVKVTERVIEIEVAGCTIMSKLIDGTFPEYDRVIPKGTSKIFTASKYDLLRSIQIVDAASTDKGHAVKFAANGNLTISAGLDVRCSDICEAEIYKEQEVVFNSRYCADLLAVIEGDDVSIENNGAGSPSIWRGSDGDSIFVLMPMRC